MLKIFISPTTAALCAALFFGASTPFAKQLMGHASPLLFAGLLYAGSGIGLILVRLLRDRSWQTSGLIKKDWSWFSAAIFFGGILAPISLLFGLQKTSASIASLLLNLEAVFTALLAWIVFKEHTAFRIILGMMAIVVGGILLSFAPNKTAETTNLLGVSAIATACLCWALDNNLTRKVSECDALFIAGIKGFVSGGFSLTLAFILDLKFPNTSIIGFTLLIGFIGYGISLVLFVLALRGLGTARTGAYFSTAPFIGAAIAIVFFNESTSFIFWSAAALMGLGVWLHLSEYHEHKHTHEVQAHSHPHIHDEHHRHDHEFPWDGKEPHTNFHQHDAITHTHSHFPDIHHRHKHKRKTSLKNKFRFGRKGH